MGNGQNKPKGHNQLMGTFLSTFKSETQFDVVCHLDDAINLLYQSNTVITNVVFAPISSAVTAIHLRLNILENQGVIPIETTAYVNSRSMFDTIYSGKIYEVELEIEDVLLSKDEITQLYETGEIGDFRYHQLINILNGVKNPVKLKLSRHRSITQTYEFD